MLPLVLLAGCDALTYEPGAPANRRAAAGLNSYHGITPGAAAARVVAIVGEPESRVALHDSEPGTEVWSYRDKVDEVTRQVPLSFQEVPSFNPFTGVTTLIKEPVMGNEFTTIYQEVKILVVGGIVADINRTLQVERHIN